MTTTPLWFIEGSAGIFPIRGGDWELYAGDATVAPEPDPATGTLPVIAVMHVSNPKTGERREQTVYITDIPKERVATHVLAGALRAGLEKHADTVRRRLERMDDFDITPQRVFTPEPVRTRMSKL